MTWLLRQFDRWLFEEYAYDVRALGMYRVLFGAYLLLASFPGGLWIPQIPEVSFAPPVGLAALFLHYPPGWVLVLLNAVGLTSAALLMVGLFTPVASIACSLAFVATRSFCYADGKIDHDILAALTPLVFAFSGWGGALSVDARRGVRTSPRPWLLALLSALIGCALFSAGAAKVHGGWLSLKTHATVWHLLPNYYLIGREQPLAQWALGHFPGAVWEMMDWSTTLWESTVIVCAVRRRAFLTALAVGCLFHFGVWHLYGIVFASNVVVYGAFVPWDRLLVRWPSLAIFPGRFGFVLLGGALVLAAVALFVLRQSFEEAFSLHIPHAVVTAGLVFGVGYLVWSVAGLARVPARVS